MLTTLSFCVCIVFFFKQKTAYEMRISDWSSDVCSSDLIMLPRYAAPPRPIVMFETIPQILGGLILDDVDPQPGIAFGIARERRQPLGNFGGCPAAWPDRPVETFDRAAAIAALPPMIACLPQREQIGRPHV